MNIGLVASGDVIVNAPNEFRIATAQVAARKVKVERGTFSRQVFAKRRSRKELNPLCIGAELISCVLPIPKDGSADGTQSAGPEEDSACQLRAQPPGLIWQKGTIVA